MARRKKTSSLATAKPRGDAKLLNLPEEQRNKLIEWLIGGMPYHQARLMVAKEFGVQCSLQPFSEFWRLACLPILNERRRAMVQGSAARMAEAKANPEQFFAASLDALKEKVFQLSQDPNASAEDLRSLFVLLQKESELALRREALQAEREKFLAAQKTKLEAGLEAVAEAFKRSKPAMEFYQKARALVAAQMG